MHLTFEHDFQRKFMHQAFGSPTRLATETDVQGWRKAWMDELKAWHSPYSVLVDCTHLSVADDLSVTKALDLMVRFFKGLHLRRIEGFGLRSEQGHSGLPFVVHSDASTAYAAVGLRDRKAPMPTDFRSTVRIENHFKQQVVEMSFQSPVTVAAAEIVVIKSKLLNALAQWHSPWSLLIDCGNLTLTAEAVAALEQAFQSFKGFHLKAVVGYGKPPTDDPATYPFKVFRARHKAAAELEPTGAFSGEAVRCRSQTPKPTP